MLLAKRLYGIHESLQHFNIVYEVYPSKANVLLIPTTVGTVVYDGSHSSCERVVFISKKIFRIAKFKCSILVLRERVHLVCKKCWNIVC